MSIWGIVTLLVLIFCLRKKEMLLSKTTLNIICFFLAAQIGFVFRDIFVSEIIDGIDSLSNQELYLYPFAVLLLIAAIFIIANIIAKRNHKKTIILLTIAVLISMVYTEFFNGVYTFNSYSEFRMYHKPLKKYYYIVPYKLIKNEYYGAEYNYAGEVEVYYNTFLFPINVRFEGRKLFYQRYQGGTSYWYDFEIPLRQQVL